MGDSYASSQRKRDAEYEQTYKEWVASLPSEERAKLEKAGVLKPHVEKEARGVGMEQDLAETAVGVDGNNTTDRTATLQEVATRLENRDVPAEQRLDDFIKLADIFIRSKSRRTDAVALCFATGSSACYLWDGVQSKAAEQMGIPRQNLNKAVKRFQRLFNLPPNRFTRPERVSRALSEIQKSNHWRRAKFKAPGPLGVAGLAEPAVA